MGNLVLFWGFVKQGLQCLAAAGAAELSLCCGGCGCFSGEERGGENKRKSFMWVGLHIAMEDCPAFYQVKFLGGSTTYLHPTGLPGAGRGFSPSAGGAFCGLSECTREVETLM